jgi:hypothetical protein
MNNKAAIGYAIIAAKALEMTDKQIKYLVREMEHQMDVKTEDQAEKAYREF